MNFCLSSFGVGCLGRFKAGRPCCLGAIVVGVLFMILSGSWGGFSVMDCASCGSVGSNGSTSTSIDIPGLPSMITLCWVFGDCWGVGVAVGVSWLVSQWAVRIWSPSSFAPGKTSLHNEQDIVGLGDTIGDTIGDTDVVNIWPGTCFISPLRDRFWRNTLCCWAVVKLITRFIHFISCF